MRMIPFKEGSYLLIHERIDIHIPDDGYIVTCPLLSTCCNFHLSKNSLILVLIHGSTFWSSFEEDQNVLL